MNTVTINMLWKFSFMNDSRYTVQGEGERESTIAEYKTCLHFNYYSINTSRLVATYVATRLESKSANHHFSDKVVFAHFWIGECW